MKFNVELAEGTNWITLTVTNSAGLSSETNMAVVKNDMTLALTSIDGDLWQATVNFSGIISDASHAVTVNGVAATVDTADVNDDDDPIPVNFQTGFYGEDADSSVSSVGPYSLPMRLPAM